VIRDVTERVQDNFEKCIWIKENLLRENNASLKFHNKPTFQKKKKIMCTSTACEEDLQEVTLQDISHSNGINLITLDHSKL